MLNYLPLVLVLGFGFIYGLGICTVNFFIFIFTKKATISKVFIIKWSGALHTDWRVVPAANSRLGVRTFTGCALPCPVCPAEGVMDKRMIAMTMVMKNAMVRW